MNALDCSQSLLLQPVTVIARSKIASALPSERVAASPLEINSFLALHHQLLHRHI